jgi:hypothetical protein
MLSPRKVFVSSARVKGESYFFSCCCEGDDFELVISRHDLDTHVARLDPTQPISHRLTRLPWMVSNPL